MKRAVRISMLFFAAVYLAWSQTPQSPELKQLQPFVGQWACTGEVKLPAVRPTKANYECSWEQRGLLVRCQIQRDTGDVKWSEIFGYAYDNGAKVYILAGLSSNGTPFTWTGTLQGGKFHLEQQSVWRNKPAKYSLEVSPDAAAQQTEFTWRLSVGGGPAVVTEEMKCTRQK